MDGIQKARAEIDRIDAELARLFEARMAAAAEIAACKQANGLPIRDPVREAEVLKRNTARIPNAALHPHYMAFQKALMACSRRYQAELIQAEGTKPLLTVHTAKSAYPVYLRRGLLQKGGTLLDLNRRVFLVTDEGIPNAYTQALAAQCRQVVCHTVAQGEGSKSPAVLEALLSAMLEAGLTRSDCVLAVGGGVVGDLAGLAAALYQRGIDWYNCPTTTLSMVDSSIGGKTAINLCGVKNAVGAFAPPRAVLIDPDVLDSLPQRQFINGLAEAVKMGLTHDAALFARFEHPAGFGPIEDVIAACLRIKQAVVEADEQERGLRRVLNYGHTLGHGIEAAADGVLLHGECVGLGMLPMCAPNVRARLKPVLERLGLPTYVNFKTIDPERVLAAAAHDKKAQTGGELEAVYVPEVGAFQLRRIGADELRALLFRLGRSEGAL
ncbi:MAG: iron-containing alcohol dehydrogenase [Oscillospiraceae bacterium]|nr:iron-containing alcohol dehydrogenase [Oscillospiraceae bacterium]